MAGTYGIPEEGSPNSSQDPLIKTMLKGLNEKLNSSNLLEGSGIANETIKNAQLSAEAKPFDWYTPKIIATEESRTNTAFGTLTTADEIKEVVVPTNGLILIGYQAIVKQSVSSAGRVAIFIGANQLKGATSAEPKVNETTAVSGTEFFNVASAANGLGVSGGGALAHVTTGQLIAPEQVASAAGGFATVFVAAGTYAISVQFKASSGSITAKERKLWVGVMGV